MSILMKKRVPLHEAGGAVQINGLTGEVEAPVKGGERIFSRPDTANIVELADGMDDVALGQFVYDAIKKQDSKPQETTPV